MKNVYYRFIQKTYFFPLFNLQESDGLRHIVPFVHQDDCQQEFWHRCRLGNITNKTKTGGKFNAMTLLGAVKHKHETINRQFESDYNIHEEREKREESNYIIKNIYRIKQFEKRKISKVLNDSRDKEK